MEKYKVVVIQQCLRNNKVAEFGTIVSESELQVDAKQLVEKGFIIPYNPEAEDEKPKIENIEVDSTEVKKEVKPKK